VPESPIRQSGRPAFTQAGSARVLTCSGVTFGFFSNSKSRNYLGLEFNGLAYSLVGTLLTRR
jgi:hypothetical protein